MLIWYTNSKFALFLYFLQVHATFSCTFLPVDSDFNATINYEKDLDEEDLCLTACLGDPTCTFVKYSGNLCTVYMEGFELQAKDGGVFELNRQLTTVPCSREVHLENVEEHEEPEADVPEQKPCRAWQDC
ncbi:unnamed protein product [Cylicocyclus nassatus]|uniref:Apple domain-containing protein n=1 Tax=Cylicocyclus nassatus TaxID=53992 RepID=A0AA36GGN6_CYLNA|nr:unnamed protein product [Cylicocyclus nassatus]